MHKVFITGPTGGAGRMAIDYAVAQGAFVTAMGRNSKGITSLPSEHVRTYMADLGTVPDEFLRQSMVGHDAVWHCAGLVEASTPLAELHRANVEVAERVFNAAGKARVPVFVHISSPALYFNYKIQLDIPESYDPGRYASDYAITKAEAEKRLLALSLKYPMTKLIILRPRALYGPYDRIFMPKLIRNIENCKGRMFLPAGGAVMLDLCYQGNLAHAMWLASRSDAVQSGDIFNITDDEPVSVEEIVLSVAAHLNTDVRIKSIPYSILKSLLFLKTLINSTERSSASSAQHSLGAIAFDTTLSIRHAKIKFDYSPAVCVRDALLKTLNAYPGVSRDR